jgi:predicted transcriptional regulator
MPYDIIQASEVLEHPSVQSVLEIAKDLIYQNKILNTELLYNTAKKKLGIPRKGLLTIIQTLLNRKILVEGSKYTKDTVLNNRFRRKLYEFIKNNLGTHFSHIKNYVDFSREGKNASPGRLIWHLEMLLKFNLIKKVKVKNYTLFLPVEVGEDDGLVNFILRDEINYKIIAKLLETNMVKVADVYKELGEKRELVYYRVKNLIDFEILIYKDTSNKSVKLNPKIIELIKRIMRNRKE